MIRLKQCSKLFGQSMAVNSITLDISGPGLVLLLGGNGAGKSTLLRICAGLVNPTSGSVNIDQKVAYLGHSSMLYPQLTVEENLRFFAKLQGVEKINSNCEWLELEELFGKLVSELSQGQRARVALARVLNETGKTALLLDEPSAAFDKRWQELFISKISEYAKDRLLLVVTHDPENFINFASRVLIVSQGKLSNDFELTSSRQQDSVLKAFHEVLR